MILRSVWFGAESVEPFIIISFFLMVCLNLITVADSMH